MSMQLGGMVGYLQGNVKSVFLAFDLEFHPSKASDLAATGCLDTINSRYQ